MAALLALAPLACKDAPKAAERPPFPAATGAPAPLRRLTAEQYRNSLRDVFGADLVLPAALEPDSPAAGLRAVGASETTISAWGVEQYESAAYSIARQVLGDAAKRAALAGCTPAGTTDDGCVQALVRKAGRRLFRRPLSEEEVGQLVTVAHDGATTLGDFWEGAELALAVLLQSPSFLFRPELGTGGRFDDYELAARLSYFLWNTTPDDALLDAAERGELHTEDGLAAQARRLLDDPRARQGVRAFFTDLFELYRLDALNKDPTVFVHFSTELGQLAREETLTGLEHLVFDEDGDYRDVFTTRRTWVNRRLAAIYDVPAPSAEGFGEVELPEGGGRRGLLGQVSFLALRAHPTASSAVLRGLFVRKILLCDTIPPPPTGVNTALPEPSSTARTLRERSAVHLQNAVCSSCHSQIDPIGLGFETFDGIGRWRTKDNGAPIDASGELDGVRFSSAWGLAEVVRDHPNVPRCLVRSAWRAATGRVEDGLETELLDVLTKRFAASGYRVKALLFDIVTSPELAAVREVTP